MCIDGRWGYVKFGLFMVSGAVLKAKVSAYQRQDSDI